MAVRVGNTHARWRSILSGVPQGSIIAPYYSQTTCLGLLIQLLSYLPHKLISLLGMRIIRQVYWKIWIAYRLGEMTGEMYCYAYWYK